MFGDVGSVFGCYEVEVFALGFGLLLVCEGCDLFFELLVGCCLFLGF